MLIFIWFEIALVSIIGALCLGNYILVARKDELMGEVRGLGLVRGSVRSILALFIVGSYINFAIYGYPLISELMEVNASSNNAAFRSVEGVYGNILSALTGITGSVIGFYFGGRLATPSPAKDDTPKTSKPKTSK
ncbi:MAG: hypothetical protein HAW61_04695 [Candidatus Portiera sp.]|nr:hypothetical protein [Portiera sp.]